MLCCLQYHSTIYYRNVKGLTLTFFRLFVRRTGWGIEPHTCRHWVGLGLSNPATFSPIASDSLYSLSILSVSHPTRPLPEHFHYILYRLFVKGNLSIFWNYFYLFFAGWVTKRVTAGAARIAGLSSPIFIFFSREKRSHPEGWHSPHNTKGRRFYSDATHFESENDLCKPLSSRTVIPRPLGPVKLATFTPVTERRIFLLPFLGYRKETLRSLRLW